MLTADFASSPPEMSGLPRPFRSSESVSFAPLMSSAADCRLSLVGLLCRLWPIGLSEFAQSLNAPQNPLAQSPAEAVDSVDVAVVVLELVELESASATAAGDERHGNSERGDEDGYMRTGHCAGP